MFAVHAAVFPLDREWAVVADGIESADDLLETDGPATDAAEIPTARGSPNDKWLLLMPVRPLSVVLASFMWTW